MWPKKYIADMIRKDLMSTNKKSLIPLLTISKDYLTRHMLWDNTIVLSGMERQETRRNSSITYIGAHIIGKHLSGLNFEEGIDLKCIERKLVLLLGIKSEWMVISLTG